MGGAIGGYCAEQRGGIGGGGQLYNMKEGQSYVEK